MDWALRLATDGVRRRCLARCPLHNLSPSRPPATFPEAMSATDPPVDRLREQGGEALAVPRQDAVRRIRRGWLVRRALLAADVLGLLTAFFATELLFLSDHQVGGVGSGA